MDALRELVALAAPPRCPACAAAISLDAALCLACATSLRSGLPFIDRGSPGVDLAIAAHEFDGTARAIVHGLKYARRLRLAEVAAESIAAACPPDEIHGIVVPVPASPLRWRWRGFDPAEEIGLALADRTGLPYTQCLRRKQGPRQVGRHRSERLSDPPQVRLRGAAPERALLVDDVRTTGATLGACATALRTVGARTVVALTFAYVP